MACPNYVAAKLLPRPETVNFSSSSNSTRPGSVSFRRSGIRATLNDAVLSRPEKLSSMSFYELLGIPDRGSLLEIKQAYKQLALKYHPDVSPPDRVFQYTQAFVAVKEAYDTLSDPVRRELYDREIKNGLQFGFGSKRGGQSVQQRGDKSEWKDKWESQVSGLQNRSNYKESNDNMSWAARIRKQNQGDDYEASA